MKTIGFREVQIDRLKLTGDFKKRLKAPHVKELSSSIDSSIGLLHEPIVRMERGAGMTLLAGNDRVAAHVLLKRTKVHAKLVQCTDDEARQIVATENAIRRHDPQEQRAAVLALTERLAEDIQRTNPEVPKAGPGRRKTAKGLAREMVAKQRGVTPDAIRLQQYRDKRSKEPVPTPREEVVLPISNMGMDLSEEFIAQVGSVKNLLEEAARKVSGALRDLTSFANGTLPKHKARLDRCRENLQEQSDALRALIPESLCPFCKGIEKVTSQCGGCEGSAYITRSQVEHGKIADMYMLEGDQAVVLYQKNVVPVVELTAGTDDDQLEDIYGETASDVDSPAEGVFADDGEST